MSKYYIDAILVEVFIVLTNITTSLHFLSILYHIFNKKQQINLKFCLIYRLKLFFVCYGWGGVDVK
jgi:hypothetical protein